MGYTASNKRNMEKEEQKKATQQQRRQANNQSMYLLHIFESASEKGRERKRGEIEWVNDRDRSPRVREKYIHEARFVVFCFCLILVCRVKQITRACVQTNLVSNSIVSFTGDQKSWSHFIFYFFFVFVVASVCRSIHTYLMCCCAVFGASTQPGNMHIAKQYSLYCTSHFAYHRPSVIVRLWIDWKDW